MQIEEWTSELVAAKIFYVNERSDGTRGWIFGENPTLLKNDASHTLVDNWYEADCVKGRPNDF